MFIQKNQKQLQFEREQAIDELERQFFLLNEKEKELFFDLETTEQELKEILESKTIFSEAEQKHIHITSEKLNNTLDQLLSHIPVQKKQQPSKQESSREERINHFLFRV